MKIYRFVRKGIIHCKRDMECQDVARYYCDGKGFMVAALSDGAGSAVYARQAAEINVRTVIQLFRRKSFDNFFDMGPRKCKRLIVNNCVRNILVDSSRNKCDDLRQYSATLLFVAADRKKHMLWGHLGDGALYLVNKNGEVCFESKPDNIGASNRTYFSVSNNAREKLRLYTTKRSGEFPSLAIMMSDGPYTMFKNRGFGDPKVTIKEFSKYILGGEVNSNERLKILLDAMTEIESDKGDDWSIQVIKF